MEYKPAKIRLPCPASILLKWRLQKAVAAAKPHIKTDWRIADVYPISCWFIRLGLTSGHVAGMTWKLSTDVEIIATFGLLLGLFTRFFSLALMILTVVAIAAVHWPSNWHTLTELWQAYAITEAGYGNFKLPLMYLLMLLTLLFSGSGRLSVDAWLKNVYPQSKQVHDENNRLSIINDIIAVSNSGG